MTLRVTNSVTSRGTRRRSEWMGSKGLLYCQYRMDPGALETSNRAPSFVRLVAAVVEVASCVHLRSRTVGRIPGTRTHLLFSCLVGPISTRRVRCAPEAARLRLERSNPWRCRHGCAWRWLRASWRLLLNRGCYDPDSRCYWRTARGVLAPPVGRERPGGSRQTQRQPARWPLDIDRGRRAAPAGR